MALLGASTTWAQGSSSRTKASLDHLKALLLNAAQSDRARIRAARSLGDVDDPRAEVILIEALSDPKEAVRFGAASALGRPGRTASVEPLVKLLRSPVETRLVRVAAARSLGGIGDPRAVPVLVATRQDASPGVRVAARQALMALPSAMMPLSRYDLLREILTDGDASEPARADAARMLGETQDVRGIPLLIAALEAAQPAGRSATTVGEFIQARAAARSSLPVAAARALGQLRATAAVPSLVHAARKSEGEVRVAALEALTRIRAPEGIPVAIDGLSDREPRTRRWAAFLLAELEARDALGPLRSALQDSDEGVRLHATRALVKMGDASAVDQLVDALAKEQIPQVRDALQNALAILAPVGLW